MIALVCEVIQFLWTLTLFVGEIVFLALVDSKGLTDQSCKRTHYDRALIFSIIVLFPILFFNVSSIRYRWHMKSGAASGLAVDLLFFPLDTIKTRIQSPGGFLASGGFRGIYRGVGSVGAGSAPGAAAFFVTYEALKKTLRGRVEGRGMVHMLAASGGEFVSCLIRVPTEVVKQRTQSGLYGASSYATALTTLRTEGIRGFYRGFGITIAREIPFSCIQFPLYEWLKANLFGTPNSIQAALCGALAGGTAAALTTPLDVVKTRVMLENQGSGRSASVLSFPGRLVSIAKNEGVARLFSGWVPRTVMIGAGGAVFLGIYDFCIHLGVPGAPGVPRSTEEVN
ncbi:S-adenosylmethionine transporter [Trichosporon asahii var. asahii CBS 2479]|uniref:S-adenosylmethionine transporter n=1 Tax=Trichosporon asahii var. asahii (strain ATCC 90039 / CBS 2479 / JCM 2466 / KCTC 7840 / NBRC 103889/ NCYC 2677 / UAMH 7654) TaxID=1186058 RepID=J4U5G7_TRIAS|nr:S-adenosylmethionine transporter [Trichosporon asahii var. asahii CBS 2479]EJT45225.1 S-adenosylmethionine transporter [Trichosporon asahii var. asahii CBS 2479]